LTSSKKLSELVSKTASEMLADKNSPVDPINLGLTKTSFTFPVKIPGDLVQVPGGLETNSSPSLQKLRGNIMSWGSFRSGELQNIEELSRQNGFGENKILREKDALKIIKDLFVKKSASLSEDITKFPIQEAQSAEGSATAFGSAISAFEMPNFPPRKSASGLPATAMLPGGLPQIIIPGGILKNFVTVGVSKYISNSKLEDLLPNKESFRTLSPEDVKSISTKTVDKVMSPDNIPGFITSLKPPAIPARPQDMSELVMGKSLPYHPGIEIAYTLLWKILSVPKVPISSKIVDRMKEISNSIVYQIPWPIAVLLGRNIIKIIDPLVQREDLPRWDRMTLANTYFVIFLDEFLRSGADISGGFKFFLGQNLIYPLPDLEIPEIISKFKSIIGVN
jgi:hypothetical protein